MKSLVRKTVYSREESSIGKSVLVDFLSYLKDFKVIQWITVKFL